MPHPRNPGYIAGDHWVVCDVCGFEYRHSIMRKRWDGLVVCPWDFELRHPQDFVRDKHENITAKGLVRPEPESSFINGICSTRGAAAGQAIAGCAITGFVEGDIPTATF